MFLSGFCKTAALKLPKTLGEFLPILKKREARVKKTLDAAQKKLKSYKGDRGYVGPKDLALYKSLRAQLRTQKVPVSEQIRQEALARGIEPSTPLGKAIGSLRRPVLNLASKKGKLAPKSKKPRLGLLGGEARGSYLAYSGKTRNIENKIKLELEQQAKSAKNFKARWNLDQPTKKQRPAAKKSAKKEK